MRFGDLQQNTFAVTFSPQAKSADFDKTVAEVYNSFGTNSGLFNQVQQNTTLAGLQAVKITTDQNFVNQTAKTQQVITADLYIVKDTINDRVLLIAFTRVKDNISSERIEQRMLNSLKLS